MRGKDREIISGDVVRRIMNGVERLEVAQGRVLT
jgi:hypothetical protein